MKMKSFNFKIAAFLTAVVAGIAIFAACGKISDIQNDLTLTINPNVISIPLSVQFSDANPGANVVDNVTITVTGKDADKLYTGSAGPLAGVHQVKGGILQVAIKKKDVPSADAPLSFTMEIDAPGYMKAYRSFIIADQSTRMETVNMINTQTPPSGASTKNGTVKLQNGVASSVTINSGNASLFITDGTSFFDTLFNPLTNNANSVNVQLAYFNGDLAAATFPGGITTNRALDSLHGKIIGPIQFTPIGYAIVRMDVGGVKVGGFSFSGVNLTLRIDPTMINPNTQQTVKAGDQIPYWSFEENLKIWYIAGFTQAYMSSGILLATFPINRPGFWSAGFFTNISLIGNFIQFPKNIRGLYYVEIVDATTGEVLKAYREVIDSAKIDLLLFVPAVQGYVKLYDVSGDCNGALVAKSDHFELAKPGLFNFPTVKQLVFNTYQTKSIIGTYAISLKGACQSQHVALETSSAISIYFRKSSCPNKAWVNIPYQNGHFVFSGALNIHESYDFIVLAFGRSFSDNNVVVNQESSDFLSAKPGGVVPFSDPSTKQKYEFRFGVTPNGVAVDTIVTIVDATNPGVNFGGGKISHNGSVTTIDFTNIQIPDSYCRLLY